MDTLYSIYCTDSVTILAKHQNFKLIPVDTLLKEKIYFHKSRTNLIKNMVITAYGASWSANYRNNEMANYQNTGLIFITSNKITFLEFKTPHMLIENKGK